MATRVDLTIEQGATFRKVLAVKTPAGAAFPLTGFSARSQIRSSYSSPTILATFACSVNVGTSKVTCDLTDAQTTALTANYGGSAYVWDSEVYNGSVVYRIAEGQVTVTPEVTR